MALDRTPQNGIINNEQGIIFFVQMVAIVYAYFVDLSALHFPFYLNKLLESSDKSNIESSSMGGNPIGYT
jgi:hypothetical protein